MKMNSRERVQAALSREVPDRIPYCELHVDRALGHRIMGWAEPADQRFNLEANIYSPEEAKALAARLNMDNISYTLRPPVYARKEEGKDGRLFYGEGLIRSEEDLGKIELPDPYDDSLYADAESFVREKGDYSAWFITRVGLFSAMLSMGLEHFCLSLAMNPSLVEKLLDIYFDWMVVVAERINQLEFDVFVSTDDMAFKTGPFFSPEVFERMFLPRYRRVAEKISLPWVIHSDGNVEQLVEHFLSLGVAGLHPNQKGAMDIRRMKSLYGDRLCVLGNVDLNLLGIGSPEDVRKEVRELIRDVGPGGGYIITSGNSLAGYLRPENVLALSGAVLEYGSYPIFP